MAQQIIRRRRGRPTGSRSGPGKRALAVLAMSTVAGLSTADIAYYMGCSPSYVRLVRCRWGAMLRESATV